MIEPQRIGRYLGLDANGCVEPDVSADLIEPRWLPLVAFVRDTLMARKSVRSVYLRGSIARGLAIENVSDADFIYLSETNFDLLDAELERAVEAKFAFVKGLELSRLDGVSLGRLRARQQRPYFHMLLKTQCLCLAGEDIVAGISPFKLGADMVSHVFSLEHEFLRLPRLLDEGRKTGAERAMHQWFSRRIVRSGFEVTMDRNDRFTRDLYLCWEQFARFYPARSEQMSRVLLNCLNGAQSLAQYREMAAFLSAESVRLSPTPLADRTVSGR